MATVERNSVLGDLGVMSSKRFVLVGDFVHLPELPRMEGSLTGFNTLWGQLLSVTTFTLTFFVNQSYALWRKCYGLSRRLQGRLHDIDMTLAMHAARKTSARPNEPSTYTVASRQLLDLISRYVRLFNLLTYASFTRSHRPILTPRGMRRLVERGLMTPEEREVLMTAEVPATQRHNCVLMWITRIFIEGTSKLLFFWLEKHPVTPLTVNDSFPFFQRPTSWSLYRRLGF